MDVNESQRANVDCCRSGPIGNHSGPSQTVSAMSVCQVWGGGPVRVLAL